MMPPPGELVQFQPPTTTGEFPKAGTGEYWGTGNVTPEQLGISAYGKLRDPIKSWTADPNSDNVKKTAWKFQTDVSMPFAALCSTASPVMDTWSRKYPIPCEAGGPQIYAPAAKSIVTLIPGQVATQAVSSAELYSDPHRITPNRP